jgi:hypothetical protein
MHGIIFREDGLISVRNKLYTNKHKIPIEVVAAILKDRYTTEGEESSDYSASTLVQPIQKTVIERRNKWDGKDPKEHKLKIFDVMDDFFSFMGSVAHQVLEDAWHTNMGGIVEKRLYMEVPGGEILSGKMDRFVDGLIKDFKNTKVYKIMKGDYTDWATQQNVYAHLCRKNGWEVSQIQIIALLGDWKQGEMFKNNYPDCAIQVIPIRVWSDEEAQDWIDNRVRNIQIASELDDQLLAKQYPCSNEERWKNYQGTAVMKKGGKKASFLSKLGQKEDLAACKAYWKEKNLVLDTYEIQIRWSEPKRCLNWCAAATLCQQWAKEKPAETEETQF